MKRELPSRLFLLMIMGIFVSIQTVYAGPVTRQKAMQNANAFLQQRGMNLQQTSLRQAPALKGSEPSGNAPYYVFNIGDDNGFVIAAGDDCAYEILGYCDEGHFDVDNMPDGMEYMLKSYAEQIGYASKDPKVAKPKTSPSYPAVEAMLTTRWSQIEPYNDNCPMYQSTDERCVTGCVATAMAQVMYYHRNHSTREVVKAIPPYNLPSGERVEGIPKGSPIDWDNMLDSYDNFGSQATEVQRQAVANLMLYCGVSVEMEYALASAASDHDVIPALVNYFDYADDMKLTERYDYTNTEWETLIYEELGKGHPIPYFGGSHAYVVDGHDGNGFVHINWGWNGTSNGNFRLTATYAGERTMGGYSAGQAAILGAVPNGSFPRLTTTSLSLTSSDLVDGLSSLTTIPVSLSMTVTNLTGETGTFEQAVGLYKLGKLQAVVSTVSTFSEMAPGTSRDLNVSMALEATLTPGAYTLVPISRLSGSDNWRANGSPDQMVTMSIYGGNAHLTEGTPEQEGDIITFACDEVGDLCVQHWDMNGDGALSKQEAAAVTSLEGVFKYNHGITSFEELQHFTGLTSLASCEFIFCQELAHITLPPSLQSIGTRAFYGCHSLQHATIPRSVTSIGNEVFYGDYLLKDVCVEGGNTVYDSRNDCHALIETAANRLIAGGSRSVIPDGVVTIANYAFLNCTGLESIVIPQSVTRIEQYAFAHCSNVTSITISEGVTEIGDRAFWDCSAVTTVTVPSSVTSMGSGVFDDCTGLTSVNFLANVTSISSSTFSGCSSLTAFVIPATVTSIGSTAFYGTGLTAMTIPSSVTSIGSGAFAICTGLTSITIPNSVSSIDGNPFYGCPNLQSIVVEAGNPCYESDGHNTAIIETATNTLVTGSAGTVIPDGIKAIGAYAFYDCTGLTSIVIPEGVTTIGQYAFYDCTGLASIVIPEGVTTIGNSAFYKCSGVNTISLPNSLTSIANNSFRECTSLTALTIPSGVTTIGSSAFSDCSHLKSINIPGSVAKINDYTFYRCENLTSITISHGVTAIGVDAFSYCKKLASISFPSSISSIANYVFQNCTGLTSIKSYITNVFVTGKNPFPNSPYATLYVPKGLVEVYQSTPDWNKINFIEEMPIISDVNSDGSTNISDVVCLISKLLGTPGNESYSYDVNNDEQISISDVVTLINIILTM